MEVEDKNAVIRFVVKNYFKQDVKVASERTGYTQSQIKKWMGNKTQPRLETARYFMAKALIPEFKIVCEHSPFNHQENISAQLKQMLNGHSDAPGIYVFYDSLCEPIYLGKANSSLQTEIINALGRKVSMAFPQTIKSPPSKVREIVKYISAYDVEGKEHSDYPKHVESLILRIKKPLLNKQLGGLTKVINTKPEE
ncbi:hypothetical protein [Pantoea endophytica]